MSKEKDVLRMAQNMLSEGLDIQLVLPVAVAAMEFDGVLELLNMWQAETNDTENVENILALKELMKDIYR